MTVGTVTREELAWMRGEARKRLGSRAQVLRATEVQDEGGTIITYLAVTPSVPAGVRDPQVGSELVYAGRVAAGSTVTVQLPFYDDAGRAVDVRAQDRLAVTVTDPISLAKSTTVLEVVGVAGKLSEWPIMQRAVCSAVV